LKNGADPKNLDIITTTLDIQVYLQPFHVSALADVTVDDG